MVTKTHLVPRAGYQKILVPRPVYPVAKYQGRHWSGMTLVDLCGLPSLKRDHNKRQRPRILER